MTSDHWDVEVQNSVTGKCRLAIIQSNAALCVLKLGSIQYFFIITSGLCRRKAIVQLSQAAVVSVPPISRSTVVMCIWLSDKVCRTKEGFHT